jgi:hypothetical protein
MKRSYYNTTHLPEQVVMDFEEKAKSQEDMVIEVFQLAKKPMSWSEVSGFLPDMNEVSLKRSLTNLYNSGKLIKTNDAVLSKYNRPCYRYQLKNN